MVGCDGAKNQCDAGHLCGEGWHLCTLAEYVQHGGGMTVATAYRWLKGCVRENCGNIHAPTTDVCPACESGTTTAQPVAWDCSNVQVDMDALCWVGIASETNAMKKRSIGDAAAPCAFVSQYGADAATGAVCCY
jgi:hypothetical protein